MKKIVKKLKIKRRAIATLAALHFYGDPSAKLKIIGVTGTNGKTTTATLLYKIATSLGYKTGLIGTVENIIINDRRPTINTTPGPMVLNKLLKEMAEKGCEYVFMEVSSHGIDQKRIAGINFVGGIFTNLTQDHLDYHKSMENYFLTKKKFFQNLPKDSFALSNADDEYGEEILKDIKAKKYFYGINKQADFKAEIKKLDFDGIELQIGDNLIKSKLLGKFNSYNLLAIFSTANLLGFDIEKVKKILETIEPPKGRFDYFVSKGGVLGIIDFAHTPDALEKVLNTIREFKTNGSRIITVFGCGGDRDPLKRRIMGKIGVELSDVAILTSDNPRSEDPEKIIAEMKTDLSINELKKVKVFTDRSLAIVEAVKEAKMGDIILCAGKGHESYQDIKGIKHHFNDMEELKKY
ncbi:MAG TPA: UDP-N-acetylmuramoyl-L-alanyl-D-glutamate--2,6-diaminopimelate ligase [Candidatus Paceibacterota bacterium]|nr:UDP-N-acetylmuramoyl-L-alanyl-D-glutamate--2,6-diaminopimelate ligase [Candidatus Paceibacterota bacterium]HPT18207.1 UDP-N-acetylmuramoyl-L-alanyl-D-glutamate--2,6-diaminopimelate ligase [Candidatus Paceibacterota bacterium]